MYKSVIRAVIRHGLGRLNEGDPSFLLRLAAPDVAIVFPGENTWASMHRPVEKGRQAHRTHRGVDECRTFTERFASAGIQFKIEDILVNGPPWNTRVAIRAQDFIESAGGDVYNNRVVAFLTIRWGRVHLWEDYEDTQRISAWDAAVAVTAKSSDRAGLVELPSRDEV